jgi:hypothetical protein
MTKFSLVDDNDPVKRAYRRYLRALRTGCLVGLVLLSVALLVGIPHLQTTYTYRARQRSAVPNRYEKLSAWYLGPLGWQHVQSGQYGQLGCPYIMFIPWKACVGNSRLPIPFVSDETLP